MTQRSVLINAPAESIYELVEHRLQPASNGTQLVESVEDRRGPLLRAVSPLITGSHARDERNAEMMTTTLEAVKAAAEGISR